MPTLNSEDFSMPVSLFRAHQLAWCFASLLAAAPAAAQGPAIATDTTLPVGAFASYALSKDASSFDPERAENKQLLEKGFGFPVRVARVLDGYALVASPATKLFIPVPLGWQGFDDGRRTRLFPPGGDIGLVVSIVSLDGVQGWDDVREQFWQQVRQAAAERKRQAPRYEARLIRLSDGTFGVRETSIPESGGPYSSVLLFLRYPGEPNLGLRVNLFTPVEQFERYLGLAGVVVRDIQSPQR